MKMKVLKGFSTSALGKRAAGVVFEVPDGVKVGTLVKQGFLSSSRSEPTVEVAADAGTATTVAPASPAARKTAGKSKK